MTVCTAGLGRTETYADPLSADWRKRPLTAGCQTGSERILAELPADFVTGDFDLSADGSEIVFDRLEEHSELALIEGTH